MGLCDINNSPGGALEPQSVTRAKNHKVSAQAIESVWQAAMTWGSTAVQRGRLVQSTQSKKEGRKQQGDVPGIFPQAETWIFLLAAGPQKYYICIHTHKQMDTHTHTHTHTRVLCTIRILLCSLADILSS